MSAGKGSKQRKGANNKLYWENFPFPERLTITQWKQKMGDDNLDFEILSPGHKFTEEQYQMMRETAKLSKEISEYVDVVKDKCQVVSEEPEYVLSDDESEELKNNMGSMSFSEFKKIKSR